MTSNQIATVFADNFPTAPFGVRPATRLDLFCTSSTRYPVSVKQHDPTHVLVEGKRINLGKSTHVLVEVKRINLGKTTHVLVEVKRINLGKTTDTVGLYH